MKTDTQESITILGNGAWGSAIAKLLAEKGHKVVLWGHNPEYLQEIAATHINSRFLPEIKLPATIKFIPDIDEALESAEVVVAAIPTQFLRSSLKKIRNRQILQEKIIVSLAKGVEKQSFLRPTEIIAEVLVLQNLAALSGPSHAEEVARGLPASVVIASEKNSVSKSLQKVFMTPRFRVYSSSDLKGVEIAGALKNVIAIAVGICEGLQLGDNCRSALMTRGMAEMARLGVVLGAQAETFAGLSGIGDLITTCVSPYGRNRAVGIALAAGKSLAEIMKDTLQVAEGVHTCSAVRELAQKRELELPITQALYTVLYQKIPPLQAVSELMTRTAKSES